jgi:hypothetical protein
MSKLQKKPSALKRGHPKLQNMNFYKFFLLLWVIFALLDPDPDSESGSGSTDPIESGSNPDPQPWFNQVSIGTLSFSLEEENAKSFKFSLICLLMLRKRG